MSILMMAPLPARVIQVLQDFLPDELAAIDLEMNDDLVTPPILAANYFPRDRRVITTYPALTIRVVGSNPVEVRPIKIGSRVDARHVLEVKIHVTSTQGNAEFLQDLMMRYAAGVIRVLCVQHEALDTLADSRRFIEICEWLQPLGLSPQPEQAEGAIVRSVTIPLSLRRREVRE